MRSQMRMTGRRSRANAILAGRFGPREAGSFAAIAGYPEDVNPYKRKAQREEWMAGYRNGRQVTTTVEDK